MLIRPAIHRARGLFFLRHKQLAAEVRWHGYFSSAQFFILRLSRPQGGRLSKYLRPQHKHKGPNKNARPLDGNNSGEGAAEERSHSGFVSLFQCSDSDLKSKQRTKPRKAQRFHSPLHFKQCCLVKNTVVFFQHAGSVSRMQNVEAKPQITASIRTKNEKVSFQGLVEVAAAESPTDTKPGDGAPVS